MAGTKFRKVKPPFALNSGKQFSNWSAFTINSQNRFSGANYGLKIERPTLFQSLGIHRVHRFAQFCQKYSFEPQVRGLA